VQGGTQQKPTVARSGHSCQWPTPENVTSLCAPAPALHVQPQGSPNWASAVWGPSIHDFTETTVAVFLLQVASDVPLCVSTLWNPLAQPHPGLSFPALQRAAATLLTIPHLRFPGSILSPLPSWSPEHSSWSYVALTIPRGGRLPFDLPRLRPTGLIVH
jgi:hypothetical protein